MSQGPMSASVSIVIPAYNAATTISQTVEACLAQRYPAETLEVIVVDDGSTDETEKTLTSYPVVYLKQKNAGPAAARNQGWKKAQGEIVFFTDADCIPEPDWVSRIIAHYNDATIGAVGGSYGIANPGQLLADCVYQEIIARHRRMPCSPRALGSYNLSVRRDILVRVNGFDESYRMASGEDNDLSYNIRKAGFQLVFEPQALVSHYHPSRLNSYLRSQFWHGFWRVRLYRAHPDMSGGDDYSGVVDYLQPVIALLVIGMLPWWWLSFVRTISAILLCLEMVLPLPIFWAVYRRSRRMRHAFLIPVTFLRSFSRGLGMAFGIVYVMRPGGRWCTQQ